MCKVNGKIANCSDVELCGDEDDGPGEFEEIMEVAEAIQKENEDLTAQNEDLTAQNKNLLDCYHIALREADIAKDDVVYMRRQQRQTEYNERVKTITEHLRLVLRGSNVSKEGSTTIATAFVAAVTSLIASYNNIDQA